MQKEGPRQPVHPVGSVDRALTLLSLLGEREHLRVSEAAAALDAAPSTAHRLLAMLTFHGFARQDPETKAYAAGPALIEAGLGAVERLDLRGRARPLLARLSKELDETVHLVRLQDSSVVFLESIEASRALRIGSRVGRFMPAHCTAAGKAMLAQMRAQEVRALYPEGRLERMTARSASTLETLEADLTSVRERGFALNHGESEDEVAAVAVAISAEQGGERSAITVSAPITRMSAPERERAAAATLRTASELAELLHPLH